TGWVAGAGGSAGGPAARTTARAVRTGDLPARDDGRPRESSRYADSGDGLRATEGERAVHGSMTAAVRHGAHLALVAAAPWAPHPGRGARGPWPRRGSRPG